MTAVTLLLPLLLTLLHLSSPTYLQPAAQQLRPRHTEACRRPDLHRQVTQRVHQPNRHIQPVCRAPTCDALVSRLLLLLLGQVDAAATEQAGLLGRAWTADASRTCTRQYRVQHSTAQYRVLVSEPQNCRIATAKGILRCCECELMMPIAGGCVQAKSHRKYLEP